MFFLGQFDSDLTPKMTSNSLNSFSDVMGLFGMNQPLTYMALVFARDSLSFMKYELT